MAREIVYRIWCDPCMDHDERNEGEPVVVAFGAKKPRELAFCETHRKEFFDPLEELTARLGQPVDGPARASKTPAKTAAAPAAGGTPAVETDQFEKPVLCLAADDCFTTLGNRKGLRSHVKTVHGIAAADYDVQHGDPASPGYQEAEEAKLAAVPEGVDVWACPAPECAFSGKDKKRPAQALGVHKSRAHPDIDFKQIA